MMYEFRGIVGLVVSWFLLSGAIPIKETHFVSPVKYKVRLAGSFGELRGRHFHAGLDIKSSRGGSGDSIFSAEEGYISRIRIQRAGYGKSVYVNHPNGYTTVYAHLDRFNPILEDYIQQKQHEMRSYEVDILPEEGMFEVQQGSHLAYLGNTGISFGPHLHFEIRETSTDKAINPFLFGISPHDHTAPVISSVRITGLRPDFHKTYEYKVPVTGRKKKSLKPVTLEVPAWRAGIGIAAHDLIDGSHNKHGLYKLEMWVDDTLYYQVAYDRFLLKETHLIDAHTRFEVARKNYTTEVLCYRVPGNSLSIVQTDRQRGLIALYKDKWRKVELRASDYSGNESTYEFQIKRSPSFEPPATKAPNVKHGISQSIRHKNLDVTFFPGSLARDIAFNIKSPADTLATVFEIGDVNEPVLDAIRLGMALPASVIEKSSKLCLVRMGAGRPMDYGSEVKNDSLISFVNDFGKYGLMVDEKAPDITPVSFSREPRTSFFRFRIRDNIQTAASAKAFTYNVWIDDHWVPCEFRSLSESLTVPIRDLSPGQHSLIIEARDARDNLSRWQADFIKK